jgi:prepilin-type N-terminal cleavage/methylation domain-containing protein
MKARINKRNQNGFTLIEILISVIILSMVAIYMSPALSRSLGQNLDIERKDRTAFLAQWKIEEAKFKTKADFNYVDDKHDFPTPDENFKYDVAFEDITIKYENKDVLVAKTITVEVWYDGNSNDIPDEGETSTTLYTKVARRGDL